MLTNPAGRAAIARALFRMEPHEKPEERDEVDAVGEFANVITGHVKAAMSAVDATMRIGLPTRVSADAFSGTGEQVTLRVSFGGVPAALVVTLLLSPARSSPLELRLALFAERPHALAHVL